MRMPESVQRVGLLAEGSGAYVPTRRPRRVDAVLVSTTASVVSRGFLPTALLSVLVLHFLPHILLTVIAVAALGAPSSCGGWLFDKTAVTSRAPSEILGCLRSYSLRSRMLLLR